jgi:toxin ParE1/3/4
MRVILSPQARQALHEQIAYLAERNPAAARQTRDRLVAALQSLETNPNAGRPGLVTDTRELVVAHTPYLFVFEVAANQVNVLRLYHGRQDWQREMEAWSQERDAATEEDDTE